MLAVRGSKSHAQLPNPALDNLTGQPLQTQSKVLLHGDNSGDLTLAESKAGGEE